MSEVVDVVTLEELQDYLNNNERVVVDFWATWCGPCKKFAPHFEAAAEKVDAVFVKVDVDQDPAVLKEYGIRSVPTVTEFIGGERVRDLKAQTVIKLVSELDG